MRKLRNTGEVRRINGLLRVRDCKAHPQRQRLLEPAGDLIERYSRPRQSSLCRTALQALPGILQLTHGHAAANLLTDNRACPRDGSPTTNGWPRWMLHNSGPMSDFCRRSGKRCREPAGFHRGAIGERSCCWLSR